MALDVARIRQDFPILHQEMNGHPLVYLDNAATTQKPRQVIQALVEYYEGYNANVHRGIHTLAERATEAYEEARAKIARFIGSPSPNQVVFTRNGTEALNMIAYGWLRHRLRPGDVIVTSGMEHHSNLLPWQQAAQATGAQIKYIELLPDGTLNQEHYDRLLSEGNVRFVAFSGASNVLGTLNPVKEMVAKAHAVGARVAVDAVQVVPHMPVNVVDWDADWIAVAGHKMLAPTGTGFLWGKMELLEEMEPTYFGGSMISEAHLTGAKWAQPPAKFEAGTPNIADFIAFGAAVDYLADLGMENVYAHEKALTEYAWERLSAIDGMRLFGPRQPRAGLISFEVAGIHPHDLSAVLNAEGVAIRVGHHCAQPLMEILDVPATNRASFYIYNTQAEVDRLVESILHAKEFFGA
ncbi:cysteine desulfurase [Symbiobacterium thermophilum]|uniref:cysteine desulfurase n=1 Tax=Symbiobacterium thermophilum TaxID=2734 RepID=UPI0002EADBCE|nr:cysteine desulfurase [Symbiobacterium thermophilum]